MYRKSPQGWLKHWDFVLLDIISLQIAFVIAYMLRLGTENPYSSQVYRMEAFVFVLCQIAVMFLGQSYQNILRRGYYIEFTKTAQHVLMVMLLAVLYLFAVQQSADYSRLTLFYTAVLYLLIAYVLRIWRKHYVLRKNASDKKEKSMVVVVYSSEAEETLQRIMSGPIQDFAITGIALLDENCIATEISGIPVIGNINTVEEYLCHEWVDEVFVKISENVPYPKNLIEEMKTMGLTIHLSLGELEQSLSGKNFVEKIGDYSVVTSTINTVSLKQMMYKRLLDIAGGIVGCLITLLLIVIIGPMIYIKSPGPIFFSQVRIGKNGKKFKIYKFRSMYMDAEERKAELMSQNKMDGLMFKMDYDPRIIGSEKKDKNGNPKGIGNFIRKTSLDEFPQFWNVLKGDMSLVGTRPPTVDEWEQYELHHRSRMSTKPGITGMWQASGRSDITDFEEVVRLDTEYIENWSIGMDFRILLKTVTSVLKGEGSV
ncbi:sugar transferase [Blautia sp. MSJ-19]|uniref:sugar transferase n=1 Tax=Blautia sp. MSJ-19 TaxID=2841517 RepID=UPI001C0E96C3|nr:sugar transferase [Blautia sp. MSJ-19]MBU5480112.1 sugar transferase [Blautia sp. MSJ-19]